MKSQQPHDPRSRPARGTGDLLVTGATGLLGRHVCRLLSRRERRFRAMVRTSSNRSVLEGTGAWMIEGDLCNPASLRAPLDGASAVLHLAARVGDTDAARNQAVNVDGTAALLEAAGQAGVTTFVSMSSDTVLRNRRSPYAESKAQAEELVRRWGESDPSRVAVLLRAPMMLGRGSSQLEFFRKMSRLPFVPIPAGAATRRPVWVGDVAEACLAALELSTGDAPASIGLPGPVELDLPAMLTAFATARGAGPPRTVPLPLPIARRLARVAGPRAVERVEGLMESVVMDPTEAERLLGWAPITLEETLRRALV